MRINFVTEPAERSWVLRPIAESLAKHVPSATIGEEPDRSAHWNIFINYALWKPCETKTAALFTHREESGLYAKVFEDVANQVDWTFAMSSNTLRLLPKRKSSILPMYPTRDWMYKDLVLGICGRRYKSGRKRFDWVGDLERLDGVRVLITGGSLDEAGLKQFYSAIDYLIVTSNNEGGPMPVLEAISLGVPVIAPDVGFCWEYPVIKYDGTKTGLLDRVAGLIVPKTGWKTSAIRLVEVLKWLE